MSFATKLQSGQFALALEITPPRQPLPAVLKRRASLLGSLVDAVNVIQRPDRQASLGACCELIGAGIDAVWHLATRGRTRDEIAADIAHAREHAVSQVLVVLGDHEPEAPVDSPTIREVVGMLREALPGAAIGVTFNQYAHDRDKALANLLGKLRAGASYVQTQPVFDAAAFAKDVRAIREGAPGVPVVPMVLPLLDSAARSRIEKRLGISIPAPFAASIDGGEQMAWAAFSAVLTALAQTEGVSGLAIMTFEMDAPASTAEHLRSALASAGLSPIIAR